MVSGATLAVLGTLGGAAVTGAISYYTTKMQQNSQDRRREAEYFLEKKVEVITELHSTISKANSIAIPYVVEESDEMDELDEKIRSISNWQVEELEELPDLCNQATELTTRASIYLDSEEARKLLRFIKAINGVCSSVVKGAMEGEVNEDDTIDIEEYNNKSEEALQVLENNLNEPINKLE